jgi:site-specific DNA-methyltransferase (adenine-specific)
MWDEFEYMFVFSKGAVKTHNPINVNCLHAGLKLNGTTYKNYSKNIQIRRKLAKPVKDQKMKGNIWEYVVGKNKEDQEAKGHPAPFPCQLAQDHILSWSNKGDLILDPMCGSGTTCKMAKRLGRNYIGLDVSEEYCKIAKGRLKAEGGMHSIWDNTAIENIKNPTLFIEYKKKITDQLNLIFENTHQPDQSELKKAGKTIGKMLLARK